MIGLLLNLLTLIYLIIYLPRISVNQINYIAFLAPCFLNVFSLPLIVLSSISLLSKITDLNSQGQTQGKIFKSQVKNTFSYSSIRLSELN